MPDTLNIPTKSPAERPPSDELDPIDLDIQRHRKMKGHDPLTGPTFPKPSEEEIRKRIEESERRLKELNL